MGEVHYLKIHFRKLYAKLERVQAIFRKNREALKIRCKGVGELWEKEKVKMTSALMAKKGKKFTS